MREDPGFACAWLSPPKVLAFPIRAAFQISLALTLNVELLAYLLDYYSYRNYVTTRRSLVYAATHQGPIQTADRDVTGSLLASVPPPSSLLLLFTIFMSSTLYPRSQHTKTSLAIILACLIPTIAFASWFLFRCSTRKRKRVDSEASKSVAVHPYPFAVHKSIPKPHQVHPVEHRRDLQPVLRTEPSSPPLLSRKASSSWHSLEDMKSPALSVWRAQFLEADWRNLAEEIVGLHPEALPLSDRKPSAPLPVTRFPMLQPHTKVGLTPKIHTQPLPSPSPARKKRNSPSPNERRRPLMVTAFNGALKWEGFRTIQNKIARPAKRRGKENKAVFV
ncbi:uncharacterized protein ARMOST_00991 [Armillaria ostoyae]|uniref:Uncharacterized protein n=1 Tax=Armillaria ostoyae TaxID=47428 RepID=A0A284QMS5_ARMOS|nr:uncharacterized protein ARMOST_00991 [Armillaria ostoyae]